MPTRTPPRAPSPRSSSRLAAPERPAPLPRSSAQELAELRRGRTRTASRQSEMRRRAARRLEEQEPSPDEVLGTERDNVLDFRAAQRSREASRAASATRRSVNRSVGRFSEEDEDFEHAEDERELFLSRRERDPETRVAQEDEEPVAERKSKWGCPPCHWGLFVLSLLLTLGSIPIIYSASTVIALDNHGRSDFFLVRQVGYALVGALVLLGASRLSLKGLRVVVWGAYAIALLGLLATDFTPLGLVMGGVRRWFKLGPIQLQFSELAKIALIGVMADYWSRAGRYAPRSAVPWIITALLALPIVLLVFVQPHLSASSLLFLLPFFIAFYAGCAWQNIARIAAPLAVLAVVTVALCSSHKMPFLKEYQQDRIAAHFGGAADERGSNYQALQGQKALMRGGVLGAGPGGSLYKQGHLPAPHTDFILAVTGEEWGLVGMVVLLGVYGTMIFFCFHTGHSANSSFEALVCGGIGTLLGIQVICNVGVVTGMLPVTGMPLPLLSYGGSGMICTLLGLGLVLSVSRRYNCDARS
jgi:cell division protein FtsW